MNKVKAVLMSPVRMIRSLRALVNDDDHDPWLDTHPGTQHRKGPDTGKIIRGGGLGGG